MAMLNNQMVYIYITIHIDICIVYIHTLFVILPSFFFKARFVSCKFSNMFQPISRAQIGPGRNQELRSSCRAGQILELAQEPQALNFATRGFDEAF